MSWRNVRFGRIGGGLGWGLCAEFGVLGWGGLLKGALGLLMGDRVGGVGETALIYAMTVARHVRLRLPVLAMLTARESLNIAPGFSGDDSSNRISSPAI